MTSFYDDNDYDYDYDVRGRESERGGPRFDRPSAARYATQARHSRRRPNAASTNGAHRRTNKRMTV